MGACEWYTDCTIAAVSVGVCSAAKVPDQANSVTTRTLYRHGAVDNNPCIGWGTGATVPKGEGDSLHADRQDSRETSGHQTGHTDM